MDVYNRNRLTDIEKKLVVTNGEREVGRGKVGIWDYESQTTMYKISNKAILNKLTSLPQRLKS